MKDIPGGVCAAKDFSAAGVVAASRRAIRKSGISL
jgi:hypothetical protein